MSIIRMIIPAKIDGDEIVRLLRLPGVGVTEMAIKRVITYQGIEFEADDEAAIVSLLRGLAAIEAGGKGTDETMSVTEMQPSQPGDTP